MLLAKFNWLPAIVILGLQRCKITVCLPIVGAREGPASETCRDPNASKLGKPRAREGPRVGKPCEVSESCQKRWEAVGKKAAESLVGKLQNASTSENAVGKQMSESRRDLCFAGLRARAFLCDVSVAAVPSVWQPGRRAGQWSVVTALKGRVCSLVARALIATRRRASIPLARLPLTAPTRTPR